MCLEAVPDELLLEIATYFPDFNQVMTPHMFRDNDPRRAKRKERQQALRALSQTTRRLRAVFLPLAWAALDVNGMRLKIALEDDYLHHQILPCIQFLHIILDLAHSDTIDVFLVFLHALPNIIGLHLRPERGAPCDTTSLRAALAAGSHTFPTIKVLNIPRSSPSPVFFAFPNVHTLTCDAIYMVPGDPAPGQPGQTSPLGAAVKAFRGLHSIAGIPLTPYAIRDLSQQFHNVRCLTTIGLVRVPPEELLAIFSGLPQLCELSLCYLNTRPPSLEELIASGRAVLRASPSTEKKVLFIWEYIPAMGFHLEPAYVGFV
ncbi:hypothetical protein MKEN_00731000 [Mycena kentingensis (nom. inval.)]|nr:hypothetical protein MKEN_00731000 [Mycena kentingensis (nom. inval.)]